MGDRDASVAPTVVVCVVTFRRPGDLAELLPLLEEQLAGSGPGASVVVVDNDPACSARTVCESARSDRVRYVVEPLPGIAAARNRGLREAADADVLIFIDDDERPHPLWFESLMTVHRATGCAGVVGPVVSTFDGEPEPWIVAGGFFDRRRFPTGTVVEIAATNNLLLDMSYLRTTGLSFDVGFGLSGGSDTLFTRRLSAAGGRLVWCDEAVVTDVVPAARATRDWVLRRRFRIGNSLSRTELAVAASTAARVRVRVSLAVRGAARIGGGLLRIVAGALSRNLRLRSTGARTAARGLGITLGAFGFTYVEYRRSPSPQGLGR